VSARRLLYLDSQRLSAYLWRQGKLELEGRFEAGPESLGRFTEYLTAQRGSVFRMLVNAGDEEHAEEVIPFVQGRDRKALISRKLAQHFPGSTMSTVVSLGYEKGQRRNERLLLSALTNPGTLELWLDCFRASDAALAGIHTIAQLGSVLLRKLGRKPPRALLLTWQDHTIRESYIAGSHVVFSRMAPLTDSSIAGLASRFAGEAIKLHQYLAGQRMINRHEPLPAFLIAHPLALPAIRQACAASGLLAFDFIDSHDAARRIGLQDRPDSSNVELLYLHLLATSPPSQQFASEASRRDYHIARNRSGILALGAVALFGGLLFAGRNLIEISQVSEEATELVTSEAELNWRYREITATFPKLAIDNETLRRVTQRQSELLRSQRLPDQAFRLVSRALDEAPHIQLDALEWSNGNPAAKPGATPAIVGGAGAADDSESIIVRGTVRHGPASTARQTLATFEHFVELLRVDRNTTVSVRKQPLDIDPGQALRSGELDDETRHARDFIVAIVRKAAP
jgi:hypothetical protein